MIRRILIVIAFILSVIVMRLITNIVYGLFLLIGGAVSPDNKEAIAVGMLTVTAVLIVYFCVRTVDSRDIKSMEVTDEAKDSRSSR
nr:MAG TPA: hypothetical protein [Caudoviricetes sp.]